MTIAPSTSPACAGRQDQGTGPRPAPVPDGNPYPDASRPAGPREDPREEARRAGRLARAGWDASGTGPVPLHVLQKTAAGLRKLDAPDVWMRDLIAAGLRALAGQNCVITGLCPDCGDRPCARHAAQVSYGLALDGLASLVQDAASTRHALLLLSLDGRPS
jgi:hypothetical protein